MCWWWPELLHCTLIWVVFTNVALRSHSFTNPDRLSWLHGGMSAWRVASMIWDDSKALDVTHFLASFKTGQLQHDYSRSPVVWLMFCTYSVNSLHQSLLYEKISKYHWWYKNQLIAIRPKLFSVGNRMEKQSFMGISNTPRARLCWHFFVKRVLSPT